MVAGAALAISVVTYFAVPGRLHLLRHPARDRAGEPARPRLPAAAGVVTLWSRQRRDRRAASICARNFSIHPWWWWLGPVADHPALQRLRAGFPWFGAVLTGIAVGKARGAFRPACAACRADAARWSRPLIFAGRHSLAFYLIHQPVLIGASGCSAQVFRRPRKHARSASCNPARAACTIPRHGILHALLCLHAGDAGTRQRDRRRVRQ